MIGWRIPNQEVSTDINSQGRGWSLAACGSCEGFKKLLARSRNTRTAYRLLWILRNHVPSVRIVDFVTCEELAQTRKNIVEGLEKAWCGNLMKYDEVCITSEVGGSWLCRGTAESTSKTEIWEAVLTSAGSVRLEGTTERCRGLSNGCGSGWMMSCVDLELFQVREYALARELKKTEVPSESKIVLCFRCFDCEKGSN